MNWGYKILAVYLIFIGGILFLVFKSSIQNQDLVSPDYYEQELKYQQKIDQTERANALSSQLNYEVSDNNIMVRFPQEMKTAMIKAHVLLYCTADKSKDQEYNLSTENGELQIAIPKLNKGLHELRITWNVNNLSYYYQHKIMIP